MAQILVGEGGLLLVGFLVWLRAKETASPDETAARASGGSVCADDHHADDVLITPGDQTLTVADLANGLGIDVPITVDP
jgi:hypothetical protein